MICKCVTYSLLTISILCRTSYAADIVFIHNSCQPSLAEHQLELVCAFYGLDIVRLSPERVNSTSELREVVELKNVRAFVITAESLKYLDAIEFLSSLEDELNDRPPLLIMGVSPSSDIRVLSRWSNGSVVGCSASSDLLSGGVCTVGDVKNITRQLAGLDIPFNANRVNHLILDKTRESESILNIMNKKKDSVFNLFVRTNVEGQEIFFNTALPNVESNFDTRQNSLRQEFIRLAPLIIFLRYSCGEYCWHSVAHYANLTIDDPWLIEPYGFLSYRRLLKEMENHNFHTTIAFIPWNYDRSESNVVTLFRDHPHKLSICVHGNNHDHREFYKYVTDINDSWPAKPFKDQEEDIKQANARMEEFERLTGLSYHPVMIFPHGIAPAKTLGLLKKYNFLATSNADKLPLGSPEPQDPLFSLRSFSLLFENFVTLNRYSMEERSQANITIDLFLGNPILFYGHHDLFEDGIDAFNKTAELVNRIEPSIEWRGLEYIARHLYLQRTRDDGNYEVRAFCKSIELENIQERSMTYFVCKEESFSPPIKEVTVDGAPYPYKR